MLLEIENGTLYADKKIVCFVEAGNGINLRHGSYACSVQFAQDHERQRELLYASELGWIGASDECSVILGTVRGRNGVIPSPAYERRLVAMADAAAAEGKPVRLEVR